MFELLRRFIRGILGFRSPVYEFGSIALSAGQVVRKDGLATLKKIREIEQAPQGREETVEFASLNHPLRVRTGTNDLVTAVDTVVREEYGAMLGGTAPKVLIDAGAFIGDTSAWFLTRYPEIQVWAMEPFPDNYRLAQINLQPYGDRAHVLEQALSNMTGTVYFEGDGTGGGIGEGHASGLAVEAISVPDLLAQIPFNRIDILKMDIEGAELEIFRSNPEAWIDRVDLLIVELHSVAITKEVHAILDRLGWTYRQYRSVWYCRGPGSKRA